MPPCGRPHSLHTRMRSDTKIHWWVPGSRPNQTFFLSCGRRHDKEIRQHHLTGHQGRCTYCSHSIFLSLSPHHLHVPDHLQTRVLQWYHSSHLTCHLGVARTRFVVQQCFWWPSLKEDVREFVSADLCPRQDLQKTFQRAPTTCP